MSKSILRVVFDTNAFAPGHFDVLERGPLPRLCKQGRIVPVFSHIFLEETLRAYGVEKRRKELLERWLPFFGKIADRVCEDFVVIWHRELVEGKGRKAKIFMRPRKQASMLAGMTQMAANGTWHGWEDTKVERDIDSAKSSEQHEAIVAMRNGVSDWRRSPEYIKPKAGDIPNLRAFTSLELDKAGSDFVHANLACRNPQEVFTRWSRDKENYPYFTAFVKNMLFLAYLAMTNHNVKLDVNAQPDLDLMTHSLRADVVVSNETGFLTAAFDALWKPKGKVLLTSEQFGRLIDKL